MLGYFYRLSVHVSVTYLEAVGVGVEEAERENVGAAMAAALVAVLADHFVGGGPVRIGVGPAAIDKIGAKFAGVSCSRKVHRDLNRKSCPESLPCGRGDRRWETGPGYWRDQEKTQHASVYHISLRTGAVCCSRVGRENRRETEQLKASYSIVGCWCYG